MAEIATPIFQKFNNQLTGIEHTRKKCTELFEKKKIGIRDINLIYSGLYLEVATSFERFIEELFISLLVNGNSHPSRKVKPIIVFKSLGIGV